MFFTIVLVNFSFGDFYVAYKEILSPRAEQNLFSKECSFNPFLV